MARCCEGQASEMGGGSAWLLSRLGPATDDTPEQTLARCAMHVAACMCASTCAHQRGARHASPVCSCTAQQLCIPWNRGGACPAALQPSFTLGCSLRLWSNHYHSAWAGTRLNSHSCSEQSRAAANPPGRL